MGISLKSIGKGLKKVAKIAAPIVGIANPALGIALGAASGLGEGKNSLKSMAGGAAGGALGGLAGGGVGGGILKSVGGGGGFGGALGKIGGFAMKNPELILGAASAVQGSRQQARADKLQQQALDMAQQPWKETAGLRSVGLQGMMNQQAPDLSNIYGGGSNPFMRPRNSGFGSFGR